MSSATLSPFTFQQALQVPGLIIAALAGFCLLSSWFMSWFSESNKSIHSLERIFSALAFLIGALPATKKTWTKIKTLRFDIDILMLLGACLAAYIGNPFEGALLLFLFALSGGVEDYALGRTKSAIAGLKDLAPMEANVIAEDGVTGVNVRDVEVGAIVLVRPGEKVPLDGVVVAGASSLDESALTGESMPRDCRVNDLVFAGTMNLNGRLEVRVMKPANESMVSRISELVSESRRRPPKIQRLIDRIGPTYTLVVIGGSVLVGVAARFLFAVEGDEAVRRAISVLITASPCALIIATPVAYLSAVAQAARRGVLIKGGGHLETLAKIRSIVFDKTGTLTTGNFRVTDVLSGDGLDESTWLQFVGAVEQSSNHPLAQAINRALTQRNLQPHPVEDFSSNPGEGVLGTSLGKKVWVGRPESIPAQPGNGRNARILLQAESWRKEGKTVSAAVVDGVPGLLAFADTLREGAASCVTQLRIQGIARLDMLTGDHQRVAERVAKELHLDGFQADLNPEQKVQAIDVLRKTLGPVLVVGDGINDAPALALADVSVAMGRRGIDLALEAADLVLINDKLDLIPWLHRHAKRTARIVRQNVALAIGVMIVLSLVGAWGHVALPLAVIGHEGSTALVSLNALRLLKKDRTSQPTQRATH
ncbi:MAG: cation-translocating P-type ATPase [Planctomycetota bacterium]